MKLKTAIICLLVFTVPVLFCVSLTFGGNNIKQRMKQRLPVIKSLKVKGLLGENNQGYLSFVSSKQERADVVAAENKDRQMVYNAIARKQNTNAAVVGMSRAAQIVQKALRGEWLQNKAGKWYKK